MMDGVTDVPGLDAATEELFVGSPAAFVARRDELAKQARASGDRALAAAIKALRRPTVGAWYLNVASRAGLTSQWEFLRLGRQLRQAQAAGDVAALRALAVRRVPLESRVLRDLAGHLAHLGVTATPAGLDEARVTLSAALADPAVDALVTAGRLDRPYVYAGFGVLDMGSLQATGQAANQRDVVAGQRQEDEEAERLAAAAAEAARRAIEQDAARRELAAAEHELAALTPRKEAAEASAKDAHDRAASLTSELVRAQAAVSAAEDLAVELQVEEKAINLRIDQARGLLRP